MKAAVITLAVIGVFATLSVLVLTIAYLLKRLPPSWSARYARLRLALSQAEAELETFGPTLEGTYHTSREILLTLTFDQAYMGDHLNHDKSVTTLLDRISTYSDAELVDRHGAVTGRLAAATRVGGVGTDLLWSLALAALTAETLRRQTRVQNQREQAAALSARSLMAIWPRAAQPS